MNDIQQYIRCVILKDAMGLHPELVRGALRFSLSCFTTEDEIDRTLDILNFGIRVETVVAYLRRLRDRNSEIV